MRDVFTLEQFVGAGFVMREKESNERLHKENVSAMPAHSISFENTMEWKSSTSYLTANLKMKDRIGKTA